jgi:PhnB protein
MSPCGLGTLGSQPQRTDTFYGDRSGGVVDPCGNHWYIATRVEELSEEAIEQRAKAAGKG